MTTSSVHIIEKVRVKLTTPSHTEAQELKNNFSAFFADVVLPYIESYLDELFKGQHRKVIRMNQLKLSLNLETFFQNKEELLSQVKKLLDEKFKTVNEESKFPTDSKSTTIESGHDTVLNLDNETHYFQAICFFLERGVCPWWLSNEKLSQLLEEKNLRTFFTTHPNRIEVLFAEANASKVVRQRLIAQFHLPFLIWLLQQVYPELKKLSKKQLVFIETEVRHFSGKEYSLFFELLLALASQKELASTTQVDQLLELVGITIKKPSSEQQKLDSQREWVNIISHFVGQKVQHEQMKATLDKAIDQAFDQVEEDEAVEAPEQAEIPEEGLYVDNAGLVLVHPFLKHFFTNIGLLKEGKELANKELAVQLLHYIATGKEEDWEHTMLFEKFLCNMPFDVPLNKKSLITNAHKKEVKALLQAVLENWKALGNSSPELLQHEFLTRPGKLFEDNVSPRLVVERKTQDILMDSISWNISIVKFPWSSQILYTTW